MRVCFSIIEAKKTVNQLKNDEICKEKNLTRFGEMPEKKFEILWSLNEILSLIYDDFFFFDQFIICNIERSFFISLSLRTLTVLFN